MMASNSHFQKLEASVLWKSQLDLLFSSLLSQKHVAGLESTASTYILRSLRAHDQRMVQEKLIAELMSLLT